MRTRPLDITPEDIPVLPPFDPAPYDVGVTLSDGTMETIKVYARGPAMALTTALHTIQRWPTDKIAKLVSLGLPLETVT